MLVLLLSLLLFVTGLSHCCVGAVLSLSSFVTGLSHCCVAVIVIVCYLVSVLACAVAGHCY